MKKAKILIVALVCSVMLMGIGFAYWTDAITFTGTVGTGNMDVSWTTATIAPDGAVLGATGGIADPKTVSIAITNAYPGATGTFNASFTNNSSIPVKAVSLVPQVSGALAPYFLGSFDGTTWKSLAAIVADVQAGLPAQIAAGEVVTLPTIYMQIDPALTDLENSSGAFTITGNFQQFNQP